MTAQKEIIKFGELNAVSMPNGIVFVGSDYFSSLPINELCASFNLDERIYNRSIKGATISDICEVLDSCVFNLQPCKVFFNLGEKEADSGMSVKDFITAYEWMLYTVHSKCHAELYVVSVAEKTELHIKYNEALKALCKETGCKFADITTAIGEENPVRVINALKLYMRQSLDFAELMTML